MKSSTSHSLAVALGIIGGALAAFAKDAATEEQPAAVCPPCPSVVVVPGAGDTPVPPPAPVEAPAGGVAAPAAPTP